MKKLLLSSVLLTSLITLSSCSLMQNSATKTTNLVTQSAWTNPYPYGEATFVNDEVHLTSTGNWFYITKKTYKDFIFEAEVKMPDVTEYSNAGFIFRAHVRDSKKLFKGKVTQEVYGYQAEVDPSDRKWSGGLYEQGGRQWLNPLHEKRSAPDADFQENYLPVWNETKANAYKHLQWNKFRIECKGSDIKIYLNDILTTHVRDVKESEGVIGIQHHGSATLRKNKNAKKHHVIKYRNIKVTEL